MRLLNVIAGGSIGTSTTRVQVLINMVRWAQVVATACASFQEFCDAQPSGRKKKREGGSHRPNA